MVDASIPLQSVAPKPYDPMDSFSRVTALQNALAGLQGQRLENQQRQTQLQQLQAMNEGYKQALTVDPETGKPTFDEDKLMNVLANGNAGSQIPGVLKALTEHQQALATLAETKGKVYQAQTDAAGSLGLMAQKSNYDPRLFVAALQNGVDAKALDAQQTLPIIQQINQALTQDPSGQSAAALTKQFADRAVAGSQKAQEALKNKAQADLAAAQTPGAKAKSDVEQQKADLQKQAIADFQANPQAGGAIIDRVLPSTLDAAANASYKAAWQSAMQTGGPDAAQKIVEAAAAHAGAISQATNPNIRQARVQQAVDTEKATAPIKVNEQVQAEIEKSKQAPGAFSSVVDPALRTRAIADFEKSSNDYADKLGAAEQLQDFVRAAQSGNKVAPGLIPIAEVKQLLNRVNRNELQSVSSSAGSAFDRLQGFFNKWTEGQPIPPAVLKDTATIANTMANAAERTYQNKVAINRQVYGSKAQPITLPNDRTPAPAAVPPAVASALKSVGAGIHTLSDGSVWIKAADGTITKQ
jgi:hypothetical protein